MPLQFPRFLYAKENAMSHLTIILLIVGAVAFILSTVKAVSAYLKNRGEEIAPFRNYFGPEYDRDLLRQSSWCDGDNNPYDRCTRVDAIDTRDRAATEQHSSGSGATLRNRERD
jgi:hypothetical protein